MNILLLLTPKDELAYVRTDYTLEKTLNIMEEYRYSVIPMIDRYGKYAGTITEGDLLYNIKNTYSYDISKAGSVPISQLDIRRSYEAVNNNATIEEVFIKSMSQNFVPLVDDNDTFIGIVKRRDIIHHFYKTYVAAPLQSQAK